MARRTAIPYENFEELWERLGSVPLRRIRMNPPPGTATEKDLIRIHDREDRLYELVDGTLVEKVMGFTEGALAMHIGRLIGNFTEEHDLGFVAGADATVKLMPRLVRIPDVCFVSWNQLPRREYPEEAIPELAPALAVEVLSKGNTDKEMERKLKEYFFAGVRLVWFVDPDTRTATVYTAPDQSVALEENQSFTGGDVLPGFRLPLRELFARVPRPKKPAARKRKPGRDA
jgi:Uma2 family endonuclease